MRILIQTIKEVVAEAAGVTVEELISSSRKNKLVVARWCGMYLAKELIPGIKLAVIGREFNRVDWSTMRKGVRRYEAALSKKDQVDELKRRIITKHLLMEQMSTSVKQFNGS